MDKRMAKTQNWCWTRPATSKVRYAVPQNWPEKPQTVYHGGFVAGFNGFGDGLTILISCIFFVYGVFVWRYDGVHIEVIPKLHLLQDAAKYGPTIFPILFAAIIGQALHAIALWRLECGERLQILDQLLGSTTIFSTVMTQLKFQRMGVIGAVLIFLWSFSPLGGQASLRVLEFDFKTRVTSAPMLYLDLLRSVYQPGESGLRAAEKVLDVPITYGLVAASLMAPMGVKNASIDIWGNVKVPSIEAIEQMSTPDKQGWHIIPSNNTIYTSLIGIPMSSIGASSNTTFSIDTNYMIMNCKVPLDTAGSEIESYFAQEGISVPDQDPDLDARAKPCWGFATNLKLMNNMERGVRRNGTDPEMVPRKIIYKGVDDNYNISHVECEPQTSYVELEISCVGRNCTGTRIRQSRNPHKPVAWTWLDVSYDDLFDSLIGFTECNSFNQLTVPIQRYLVAPHAPYTANPNNPHVTNLSKETFGLRWAQIFNTFHLAGKGLNTIPNNLPGNIAGGEIVSDVLPAGIHVHTANITITDGNVVLICNRAWLAVLFVATSIMFLIGVWGLALEHMRLTPDIAMNMSSMTRDNPHMNIPSGGSAMDAAQRMRKLSNVRVRLGDVKPDDEVGYIAISTYGDEQFVDMLHDERFYA